jgi:3-hydroxybutyryl-CoA dehydrogenase
MIKTICVCGAGTMGTGIAQAIAQNQFRCLLYDVDPDRLQLASDTIRDNLNKLLSKFKITAAAMEAVLDHIQFSHQINDCTGDLIIEAIIEKAAAKQTLFEQLAAINPPDTILASNTSSLSINNLSEKIPGPERFLGLHFFNPATIMKLVELVRSPLTSDACIEKAAHFVKAIGKTAVFCNDAPGFIVNHVARPYYLEALRLAEKEIASPTDIDSIMEATGFKLGPFKLMDLIGNDINYTVSCELYEQLERPARLEPSALQKEMVTMGRLGKKTGRGYYEY